MKTKPVRLLSVQRHNGNAFVIISRSPLLSRGVKGAPVLNRSPWAEAPKDHVVGTYATEAEAAYTMGRLEERLSRART